MTYSVHPVNDYRSVVDSATQFIDVRNPDEIAECALPGATNIPLGDLPTRIDELDPNRRTVTVCRSGGRSLNAAELLSAAGFADVISLDGGMLAYQGAS